MAKFRNDSGAQELFEKLVYVGRCTKVVEGGRRFRFLAIVVIGDKRGKVGIGLGKAAEVADARVKAIQSAKKSMVKIPLREGRTLHHDIKSKYCSGMIVMKSAPAGTGIIAGGPVRSFLEVLGVKDIVAKSVGSSNPNNMLQAALKAITSVNSPRYIAEKRGKKIYELIGERDNRGVNIRNTNDGGDNSGDNENDAENESSNNNKNMSRNTAKSKNTKNNEDINKDTVTENTNSAAINTENNLNSEPLGAQ